MTFPEYLAKTGQTVYAFFKAHNLRKSAVYQASKKGRVRYETAKAISDATEGLVTIREIME